MNTIVWGLNKWGGIGENVRQDEMRNAQIISVESPEMKRLLW